MLKGWSEEEVPRVDGLRYVVTGANTGLGWEVARVLAARGASVVVACRDTAKGDAGRERILALTPEARVEVRALDLADLASVRAFAEGCDDMDGLVCNAGIMAIPRTDTRDGFEMQIGTNHLGHFVLAARLLARLRPGGRVVSVSSGAHKAGSLARFDDPFFERRRYDRWIAYCQSKLANLLFMFELDRRLRAAGRELASVGAHPGYAATELQSRGTALGAPFIDGWVMGVGNALVAQSAAAGAWPLLRALTDPEARGGDYFGPRGLGEMRGRAARVPATDAARDAAAAAKLWAWSETVTGERFEV